MYHKHSRFDFRAHSHDKPFVQAFRPSLSCRTAKRPPTSGGRGIAPSVQVGLSCVRVTEPAFGSDMARCKALAFGQLRFHQPEVSVPRVVSTHAFLLCKMLGRFWFQLNSCLRNGLCVSGMARATKSKGLPSALRKSPLGVNLYVVPLPGVNPRKEKAYAERPLAPS